MCLVELGQRLQDKGGGFPHASAHGSRPSYRDEQQFRRSDILLQVAVVLLERRVGFSLGGYRPSRRKVLIELSQVLLPQSLDIGKDPEIQIGH